MNGKESIVIPFHTYNSRDPIKQCFNKSHGIIGPSGCGKTVLVTYLAYLNRSIPRAKVCCNSAAVASEYMEYVTRDNVYTKFSAEDLTSLFKTFEDDTDNYVKMWDKLLNKFKRALNVSDFNKYKTMAKQIKEDGCPNYLSKKNTILFNDVVNVFINHYKRSNRGIQKKLSNFFECFTDRRTILIFDDVMNQPWFSARKGTIISEIIIRGRHLHLTSFFLFHSYTGLEPTARMGFNFIYILGSVKFLSAMYYEQLKGTSKSFVINSNQPISANAIEAEIMRPLHALISDLGTAIIYSREGPKRNIEDFISYFRVPEVFRLNPPEFHFH